MLCQKLISIFSGGKKKKRYARGALQPWRGWVKIQTWASIQILRSPWHFLHCVGCSSLSHFSELHMGQRDLLTFTNSSGWERWHSIKRNTSMSRQNPVSTVHEHVIALNKHKSTFTGREPCHLTLPFQVCNYSIFWKLGNLCSRGTGQLVSLKNWMKYWWGFITTLPGLPQLPPEGAHWSNVTRLKSAPTITILDGSQEECST